MNANVPEKVSNPFGNAAVVAQPTGASTAALMAREAQDIMVQTMMARQFPRDRIRAMDRILNEFTRPELCEDAEYAYSRGGQEIRGLSIRAAEVICRNWGNMRVGVVELTRGAGSSEVLAYAQDLETGYSDEKRFHAKHWRDTKKGGYIVTDERDIYELVANQGARRKRACMLGVIPGDVQDAVEKQIATTMKAKADVTPEVVKNLLEKFASFSVSKEQIEVRIQRRIDTMLPGQLIQLRRIYNSLKDGMSQPADWFEPVQTAHQGGQAETGAGPLVGGGDGAATGTPPASAGTQTDQVKEQLKAARAAQAQGASAPAGASNQGGKEEATTPKKEAEGDLGGYVPHYSEETALAEIRKVRSLTKLEEVATKVFEDFEKSRRSLPESIEPTINEKREALKQSV